MGGWGYEYVENSANCWVAYIDIYMLIGRKYLKLYSIFHILHFPIIISRMLKGVLPQLTSVNAYI